MATSPADAASRRPGRARRLRLELSGVVQGVGFRPHAQRLAAELGIAGFAANTADGLVVEVEGDHARVQAFRARIVTDAPAPARVRAVRETALPPTGEAAFAIRPSLSAGAAALAVPPDLATCDACLREMLDPADRRFRYPFVSCAQCGPRWSLLEGLPFDRERTTMRGFPLCEACAAEYHDATDRRAHAQTLCCPACGPQLALWDAAGGVLAVRDDALLRAAAAIRAGAVVAIKGVGGFQLVVDARDPAAVGRLRARKRRPHKPFAVLCASLDEARRLCTVRPPEAEWLAAPAAPIVLCERRDDAAVVSEVAPGNPWLGIMLPASGLHHLLARAVGGPVVATSGNRSGEPLCIDEHEARERLAGIADLFLVHDRPIARAVDDSVLRIVLGRELVLRNARGLAPTPVGAGSQAAVLAVGGHLKSAVAVQVDDNGLLGQHLGDLDTLEARGGFARAVDDVRRLFGAPALVVHDLHPDYHASRFAAAQPVPRVPVQHHLAHVLACLRDNGWQGPALGVAWDGTGLGDDGTLWGGEFLRVTEGGWSRLAHLRTFALPGGEAAIRTPRWAALGLLHELYGLRDARQIALRCLGVGADEVDRRLAMLERGTACPRTSSAGRLFDAAAALLGLAAATSFEGQAAMQVEFAAGRACGPADAYPFEVVAPDDGPWVVDWGEAVEALLADVEAGTPVSAIAARFHATLAEAIASIAVRVGEPTVALSGGCFQNRVLTERTVVRLRAHGLHPLWHRRVPPNDGGLALGQLEAVSRGFVGRTH